MVAVHSGLALVTATPEFALTDGEGKALAEAAKNVARHYDFLTGASQKAVDIGNLVVVCAVLYGGKVAAARSRNRHQQRAEPPQAFAGDVALRPNGPVAGVDGVLAIDPGAEEFGRMPEAGSVLN